MRQQDVLNEAPSGDYVPSMYMTWFYGAHSPIHDEMNILCQKWISSNQGEEDVWVAVPEEFASPEESEV